MSFQDNKPISLIDSFLISSKDALSLKNVLKRVGVFLLFGVWFQAKEMLTAVNLASQSGGVFDMILASWVVFKEGVKLASSTVFGFISNPSVFISENSKFAVIIVVLLFLVLWTMFFQPASLIVNIFDFTKGQATGGVVRSMIALIMLSLFSMYSFNSLNGVGLLSTVSSSASIVSQAVVNNTFNVTNPLNITKSVVSLL